MAKLPSASYRDALKAFESFGWEVVRQSGSHIILVKEGEIVTLALPAHNPVAKGTLRGLIRAAGLTVEEFVNALLRQEQRGVPRGTENRQRPSTFSQDRAREGEVEPFQVHLAGGVDREEGEASGQHSVAADRDSAVSLRTEGDGRRRAGGGRTGAAVDRAAGRGRRQGGRSARRTYSRSRFDDGGIGRDSRRGTRAAPHRAEGAKEHRHDQGQIHRHSPDRAGVAAPFQADLQAGVEATDLLGHLSSRESDGRADPRRQAVSQLEGSSEARERRMRHLHDGCLRFDDG